MLSIHSRDPDFASMSSHASPVLRLPDASLLLALHTTLLGELGQLVCEEDGDGDDSNEHVLNESDICQRTSRASTIHCAALE